jgi:uncharacterized phiE125 gp8 family phage protein
MSTKLITEPAVEPVSLEDMQEHLRVETDGTNPDDDVILALISVAREFVERFSNRALITQTWELALDAFPCCDHIVLPYPPLQSIFSLKYYDTDETELTISSDNYQLDTYLEPGKIILAYGEVWPSQTLRSANGVIVRYVAGFGNTASDVPGRYKHAIKMVAAHLYENREDSMERALSTVPIGASELAGIDRVVPI